MPRVHFSFPSLLGKDWDIFGPEPQVADGQLAVKFWQKSISVEEVLISSVVLILLGAGVVAWRAHYPYYPCCFHQLSAAIRHWNFQGLDPSQPKEFWGFSYLSALVAAVTRMPDIYAIVVVSATSFVIANYLGGLLWDTTIAAWLMVINYSWLDSATEGMTDPLFMALLLGAFIAFRRQQSVAAAFLASAATIVRPVGLFALIAIGVVLLAQRELRRLALAAAIGLGTGILYVIPLILIYGDPFANIAGYHKEDWQSAVPVTVPLLPIIKGAIVNRAFEFWAKLHIVYSSVNAVRVLLAVAGMIAMAARQRFWDYAKTYPAEAIFAGTYGLFLLSYNSPLWAFYYFPRFVIPLIPFLLLVFRDYLPRDRRILWGVALLNLTASVGPKATAALHNFG